MKKCFTVNCMRKSNDFDGYEKILKEGLYQGIEIFFPYNVSDEQRDLYNKRVKKIIEEINPEMVLHLPHGKNNDLITENGELNNLVIDRMKNAISYASQMGAKKLTLHLGYHPKDLTREQAVECVIKAVEVLCDFAKEYDSNIMIENMPGYGELGYSPDEILYIIEKVNKVNLKFILDTGHAHCSKYELIEYVQKLSKYLYHMHFNDNDGTADQHKRVNSGTIDFKKLFTELNNIKYDQLHCMEVIFKEYTDLIEYEKDIIIYDYLYK